MGKPIGQKYSKAPIQKFSRPILDEIAQYAQTRRGFMTQLAAEMTRLSKDPKVAKGKQRVWSRAHIDKLLTLNYERRAEPNFGTGLMLQQAYRNLRATDLDLSKSFSPD